MTSMLTRSTPKLPAAIVSPITEHGFRSYTAADCEGGHWVFACCAASR